MCTNYTNLNQSFSKDSYTLSSIDRLVDEAAAHHILSVLDAYSG